MPLRYYNNLADNMFERDSGTNLSDARYPMRYQKFMIIEISGPPEYNQVPVSLKYFCDTRNSAISVSMEIL